MPRHACILGSGLATLVLPLLADVAAAPVPRPKAAYLSWSTDVSFSPDGRYLIAYGTVKDLKADTTTDLKALRLAFTADGKRLYGMFKDQTLKCWDVPGFKERFAVTADHGPDFHNKAGFYRYGIVVSPDGSLVATYRPRSETFKVWDGTTGRAVRDLTAPSIVWSLAVSPDGRWIAAGGEGRQVTLWELASGKKLETFESAPPHTLGDDVGDGWVNQLCFGPDGRYLAAGTSYLGGTVEIHPPCHLTVRDLAAGRNRFRIDIGEHYMRGLAYSADGQQIATAGYGGVKFARKWNGAVKYWSAETGAAEGETAVDDRQYIYGVAYHPDGKRVGVFHNEPKVWDVPRR
ncbi:MAG TPA: hypothetical protein VM533_17265 [Fimbriiglobus sp.]|jgi:WD40 repeat protein|nr:hypothetical protein [Fimbriiglobus sp.]